MSTPGRDPRERFVTDVWPLLLLLGGLLLAVVLPWLAWDRYGGDETWPSLITNFSSTCLAFLIALAWDRRQRAFADRRELEAEQRREEAEARAEHERRTIEARRRFSAIALELERIEASLQRAHAEQHRYKVFFPDLPSGSWRAASGPLGLIVSDYGLMADLATFYGHVAELQWRLRFKAQPATVEDALNPLIDALVLAMLSDVEELLPQVRRQLVKPDVERVHGEAAGGTVVGRRQFTAAIRVVGEDGAPADETRAESS
ncbi:MAG TPA: hypothetical protein VFR43_07470 [Gaiellaceae bacterium]|nr:hypothetical protein [Gaiellaceae bacterium]